MKIIIVSILMSLVAFTKCDSDHVSIPLKNDNNISLEIAMYPSPYVKKYILDTTKLVIVLKNKITKKDSLLTNHLLSNFDYNMYSKVFDSLQNVYENKCINDGVVYNLILQESNSTKKNVRFSNVYNESLNEVITFINDNVNDSDKILYDKKYFESLSTDCD